MEGFRTVDELRELCDRLLVEEVERLKVQSDGWQDECFAVVEKEKVALAEIERLRALVSRAVDQRIDDDWLREARALLGRVARKEQKE